MNVGFLAKENIEKFGEYDILVFEDKEYSNVKAWDRSGGWLADCETWASSRATA